MVAVIVVCQSWTAAHGAFYPNSPLDVPLDQWPQHAFRHVAEPGEFKIADQLARLLPAGSRVLSDSANLHAALIDKGVEVVPVWSPEVRFLFSSSAEESERQLRALHIGSVAYYDQSLNTRYLAATSPFYATLPQRWRVLAVAPGVVSILVPGR
jgi:hypothetical protein